MHLIALIGAEDESMAKCVIRGTYERIEMEHVGKLNGIVRPVLSHRVDGWKKVKFWTPAQ